VSVSDLPAVNASLNGLATVLLTVGFIAIKLGKTAVHRASMLSALGVSMVFLVTYVIHKILVRGVHTPFAGSETMKHWVYLPILFSHIILAIAIVPMVIMTLRHAFAGRLERHRAWARWTFPCWYYVSVTGVLVYLFLYVWYPTQ